MTSWRELIFVGGVARADGVELRLASVDVSIESAHGRTTIDDPSVSGVGQGITVWWNRDTETILVGAKLSEALYSVSPSSGRVSPVDHLFRDDDEELRFLSIHTTDEGSLLLLYERGLLCITREGLLRWHRLHDDLSARLVGVENGIVVIERQWPFEEAGKRTRFRLVDGEELLNTEPVADDG